MYVYNKVLIMVVFTVFFAVPLYAQQKPPVKQAKAAPAGPVKTEAAPEEGKGFFSYQSASGAVFTLGGGYYSALGDMAKILKPSWAVKMCAQNNNAGDTLFGLGIDASYAMLKDLDVSGGIVYTTLHPNVTATFSFFDWFDIQGKAGPGISMLTSTLNGKKSPSVSLTLGAGGGIIKVFAQHYILGLEGNYYYFFQRESSRSVAGYLYMGYRL